MPTNFLGALINLFRSRGLVVEIYLGGSDEDLKNALKATGGSSTAACASLAYEWIARQLLQGHLAGPDNPMFTDDKYGVQGRQRVAHRQHLHELGLKAMQESAKLLKSTPNQPDIASIKNYPYEAMIATTEALITRLTHEADFGSWGSSGSSDRNIANMFAGLQRLAAESKANENSLKQVMMSVPPPQDRIADFSLGDYQENARYWAANFDRIANQSPDYFAILVVRNTAFGHAMGIRYQPAANLVHFFDANVGHFRFQGWKEATDYIQAYWRAIWQEDVYSSTGKTEVYPPNRCFLKWAVFEYRKKPLDPDFEDFLW